MSDQDADWTDEPDARDDYDTDDDGTCFHCGGDGYVYAIEDSCDPWNWGPNDLIRCRSCRGSGLAKDMTIW